MGERLTPWDIATQMKERLVHTMEPLYREHIGTLEIIRGDIQWNLSIKDTLETVLYIEVVLNSEVIYSGISL